jgi:hypothetical protein
MLATIKKLVRHSGLKSAVMRMRSDVTKRIVGQGNVIQTGTSLLKSVELDIVGNHNSVVINDGCTLSGLKIHIRGDNHKIVIESGCRFVGGGVLWFEDSNGVLIVGKNTTFEGVNIAITEPFSRVDIGEDCMFAYDIDIRTGDSHSILDLATLQRLNFAENVRIDSHVWVTAHCILLKGVHVREGSVVATGACVTKAFDEPNVVLAGNPAKVVKRQITWARERLNRVASAMPRSA